MIIGVDFDNTIVCYDDVFRRVALEQGLVPAHLPASKGAVRDYLRQEGREDAWTELQGYVYGARMAEAAPFPGVIDFFMRCRRESQTVLIISHKTRYPYRGARYDLHETAGAWLKANGFFDRNIGLDPAHVCFELSKDAKLARIAGEACTHFVDDLPEFLDERGFPRGVIRILFDPSGASRQAAGIRRVPDWAGVESLVFSGRSALQNHAT